MNVVGILEELLGNGRLASNAGRQILQCAHSGASGAASGFHAGPESRADGAFAACPCCSGKGAFDLWAKPCEKGHMHEKMACPTCDGKSYFAGADALAPCPKCAGKGAFNHWDKPCMSCDMHFKRVCPTCNGKCYLPTTDTARDSSNLGGLLGDLLGSAVGEFRQAPGGGGALSTEFRSDDANAQAKFFVRALVNAAKCDGRIDAREKERILDHLGDPSSEEYQFLLDEFTRPLDVDGFGRSVPLGMEERVYALSLTSIDLDTAAEANYLRQLARALRLQPAACAKIHRRLGVAVL